MTGDELTTPGALQVRIYNPLQNVLEHFVKRLVEGFLACGIQSELLPAVRGEFGHSLRAKMRALGTHVKCARLNVSSGEPNVVTWPLLGWWESPLWQHNVHSTFVVIHDPEPLVRQHGLSVGAARCAARMSRSNGPQLVVMSPEAHAITTDYFGPSRVHLVPHPMSVPNLQHSVQTTRGTVLVLGQCKPARDLDLMAAIGPPLRVAGWNPTVAGRGWPPLPGWHVIDRFLSESEFGTILASASVVILPYQHYFQSGVALRALEVGVPVVGRRTGFLTDVLGADFPGAVEKWSDHGSWMTAIESAVSRREDQLLAASAYATRGATEWFTLVAANTSKFRRT